MAKQLQLTLHSLTDSIVLEGIKGISLVKEENRLKGHIAGGMAVQSYLPESLSRKTIDLDFRLLWGGVKNDFDRIVLPLQHHLQDMGYEVSPPKKEGTTYDINVRMGENSLVLQHQRASPNNFEKHKKSLEREMANQRAISKQGVAFAVMSPEDIVTHKLSRVLTFNEQYHLSYPYHFFESSAEKMKEEADNLRADVIARQGDVEPRDIARIRVLYDCADVKNLSQYAGLNRHYMFESFLDWAYSMDKPHDWLLKGLDFVGISLTK